MSDDDDDLDGKTSIRARLKFLRECEVEFGLDDRFFTEHSARRAYLEDVGKLMAVLDVVRENYDKCRLVPEEVVQTTLARGKGYIGIPHEECIEEIKKALDTVTYNLQPGEELT